MRGSSASQTFFSRISNIDLHPPVLQSRAHQFWFVRSSYSVSKRNFGRNVSLIAASALLIDYVMTVAVSTTSAVEQITSAISLRPLPSVDVG